MKDNNNGNITFYVALAVFIIISVLGLTYMLQNSSSYDERGTFGDMFGFANALFTGLSVVGLIATIFLQRRDLNIQRTELKRQTDSIQIQNFENTFFQMMNILFKVMEEVYFYDKERRLQGRSAISMIHYTISRSAQVFSSQKEKRRINIKQKTFNLTDTEIINILKDNFESNKNQIESYYRTIFNIVQMIDENPFINKRTYINILISQLSRMEIMMLCYYVILPDNTINKELIDKHKMLKDLDIENMIFPNFAKEFKHL